MRDLKNIDLNNEKVNMKAMDVNIGFAIQLAKSLNEAVMFARSIVAKFFDKSPLTKTIVRNFTIFDLKVMMTERSVILQN